MNEDALIQSLEKKGVAAWQLKLARWVESSFVQYIIVGVILLNSVILGLETFPDIVATYHGPLSLLDKACLTVFLVEVALKLVAYRGLFWRDGWNVFDFLVVAIALIPSSGPFAVLRALRVLRVLRLLTVIPSLQKVVAAFFHAIPGLGGVIAVMAVFFFTAGVLASHLFGQAFPHWFGNLGYSLYTLFQIMTLESWSMGIVRPVMEVFPWAWMFFVPFIIIATFTILNLFIGIIVSTMQELNDAPKLLKQKDDSLEVLERMEADIKALKASLNQKK